jgi:hypothetical protein
MVCRGRDQQRGRDGGEEEGDEEDLLLRLGNPLEPVRERNREQECEEHLHPREHHPELVQELDQLAIELLVPRLARHRADRSIETMRGAGRTCST